jgi:HEAT repeat protein
MIPMNLAIDFEMKRNSGATERSWANVTRWHAPLATRSDRTLAVSDRVFSSRRRLTGGILLLLMTALLAPTALLGGEEQDLIARLQSASVSIPDKCAACQRLRVVGTAEAVPALAALLTQERMAHAARYALEGMPYPEAGAALTQALATTSGLIQAGLIDSLGWRRDAATVPTLVPLLRGPDVTVAEASATALGRIANPAAISALQGACAGSSGQLQFAIAEALLRCADIQAKGRDLKTALAIYRFLFSVQMPERLHVAAWRGLVLTDAARRVELVSSALSGTDRALRLAAQKALREGGDISLTKACVRKWSFLPPDSQLAVLDASLSLGKAALATARLAAASPDLPLRIAGWQALADLGETRDIPKLAQAAARGEPAERDAARDTLARLHGAGMREAIVKAAATAREGDKIELLAALGTRGEPASAGVLLENAGSGSGPVRLAALEALRKLAVPGSAVPLLKIAAGTRSDAEREAALKGVYAVCQASRNKEETGKPLLEVLSTLTPTQRAQVLPLLAELGTPAALAAAQSAARDSNPELMREGIRVLSQWQNALPSPTLHEIARNTGDAGAQVLALRGLIQLTGFEPDPAKRLATLREAIQLAKRDEEKKQALGQIGQIATVDALQTALAMLNEPDLANEAGLAAITVAEKIGGSNKTIAAETAAKVLAQCRTPDIVKRAWALRDRSGISAPFIRDWVVCGPYTRPSVGSALAAFNAVFKPETSPTNLPWKALPPSDTADLLSIFPDQANCAAYLKTTIIAPEETDAILLLGSDDGIKAWLNEAVVHANNVDRGLLVDQDSALVHLKKGANSLMLKITQGGGGWAACARIVGPDGKPIPGLHAEADKTVPLAKPPPPKTAVTPTAALLPPRDSFKKLVLSDKFYAEGAYYADLNRDGNLDLVTGPFWFEGPAFEKRHEYRSGKVYDPKGYSDNFLTFAGDLNGDGWADILCVPFPGKEGYWYENPAGKKDPWKQHLAYSNIGNESPVWADVDGDGRPELVFCKDGFLGYVGPSTSDPDQPWTFHPVSNQDKRYQQFTHGVGTGDINGDKRVDILEAVGWWEQPASPAPDQPWTFHPFRFADAASQMLVYDVNGDGLADVITAWHCHEYGLVWWQQVKTDAGQIDWKQHIILSPAPDITTTDFRPSQMHALDLVDMNGDGLKDILTGKRFWSHGPTGDKEPDAPAVVVWFELKRNGPEGVSFVPHLIDDDSGVGTQVTAADLNKDGRPDVIVGNKKGIFVHLSQSQR